jgi:hypothetical protein
VVPVPHFFRGGGIETGIPPACVAISSDLSGPILYPKAWNFAEVHQVAGQEERIVGDYGAGDLQIHGADDQRLELCREAFVSLVPVCAAFCAGSAFTILR